MACRFTASVLALILTGIAQGQTMAQLVPAPGGASSAAAVPGPAMAYQPGTATLPAVDCFAATPTVDAGRRIWGGAEYLLWWVEGQRVPALVSTTPLGAAPSEAGVIGVPGTSVLFGDSRPNDGGRSGVRMTIGAWLDACRTCGVGGEFFILCNQGDDFTVRSTGVPILARPFFNTLTQTPDAQLVAFPELASGAISASVESQLLGASGFFRHVLRSGCDYSVEGLWGYRYLNLNERVTVDEQVVPVQDPATFLVHDSFQTQTQFHGGDIGLAGYLTRGRVTFSAIGKVGIGVNVRDLRVDGSTGINVLGQLPLYFDGGLLTSGRTGHTSDSVFALVPEFRLGVGYQITDCIRLTAGYNLIVWTNVARAGEQIDVNLNPNQLPPPLTPVIAQTPSIRDTTIWVQGLSLGLLFNY